MKRVVAGVIGLAAGAAMLVGCSDDKATTAENSSSQSSAASQTSAVGAGGLMSLALTIIGYGFVASVLPVWLLLAPRDYLATFLKIGVIVGLAIGFVARLVMTAVNQLHRSGGRYALCTMCIGVGQGLAVVLENTDAA